MTTVLVEERTSERSVISQGHPAALDGDAGGFSFAGHPGGLTVGPHGVVFASDTTSGTIWRLTPQGTGAGAVPSHALTGGRARRVLTPAGLALAPDGTLFVADTVGHRVWALSAAGELRVVAGGTSGCRDGRGTEALFRSPSDVAIGPDGTCFVADTGNDRVRTISPDGDVATLAGSIYGYSDGRGPSASFRRPKGLAVDAGGTCYVADTGNDAIRRITPDGDVTTLAGSAPGGDADGVGTEVGLRWPTGLAVDRDGSLFLADHGNGALRRVDQTGMSTVRFRLSGRRWPVAVASAPSGNILVAIAALDGELRPSGLLLSVPAAAGAVSEHDLLEAVAS